MATYIHQVPGTEVRFISGYYNIVEEKRIPFEGRELLCVVGVAVVGSACCGTGGCRFLNIPGYILSWKSIEGPTGTPISDVEPLTAQEEQQKVKDMLDRLFPYSQIIFQQ
jgi:hypothetical protein